MKAPKDGSVSEEFEGMVGLTAGHPSSASRADPRERPVRPPVDMPAISLWQPWASLWVVWPRLKWNETRHWAAPARHVGHRILVHAAKTREGIRDAKDAPDLDDLCKERFGEDWATSLPMGGYIGTILLAGCERMTSGSAGRSPQDFMCGNWVSGRYAWLGEEPRVWPMIAGKGQQGFWTVERGALSSPDAPASEAALEAAGKASQPNGRNKNTFPKDSHG